MFRGGPGLLGVAPGKLPDSPTLRWRFKTGGPVKSSAAIGAGRVFVGSDDGKVYALDLEEGQKVWEYATEGAVEASPLLVRGTVFVGSSDSHLYALDADTGKLKWKHETGDKILGAANWVPAAKGGGVWILVGSYDSNLYCIDSETGRKVWTYKTDSFINGAPAVAKGKAVFGGCDAVIHVVSVADGSEVARIEAGSYIAGSAALAGKYAYIGHYGNEFLCADIAGGEVTWAYSDRPFAFFSSAAVGQREVVVGSRDKRVHCISRGDGKRIWAFQTRGRVDSSPVICDGKVVVGSDDGRLYIVRLSDGKELWSYEIGQAVSASPAVAGGIIVVGSEDGYVYAFGAKRPRS